MVTFFGGLLLPAIYYQFWKIISVDTYGFCVIRGEFNDFIAAPLNSWAIVIMDIIAPNDSFAFYIISTVSWKIFVFINCIYFKKIDFANCSIISSKQFTRFVLQRRLKCRQDAKSIPSSVNSSLKINLTSCREKNQLIESTLSLFSSDFSVAFLSPTPPK